MDKERKQTNGPDNQKVNDYALGFIHNCILIVYAKKGKGRCLSSIEDCVDISIQGLDAYIKKHKERLIKAANNNSGNVITEIKTTKTKKQKCEEKQLYGYFEQRTGEISLENK